MKTVTALSAFGSELSLRSSLRTLSFLGVALVACGGDSTPPPAPPMPPEATTAAPAATAPTTAATVAPPTPAKPTYPASTPVNELTLSMLRALRFEKGNVFLSGASIRDAMAMVALGARGKTLDEIAKAVSVDPDPAKNVAAAKAERAAWTKDAGKATLKTADRLWIQKAFTVEQPFTQAAQSGYGAAPATLDFSKPDPARTTINAWVSAQTQGHIKDLLPAGSVTDRTRVVVTDAVYFKAAWVTPFVKTDTKDEPFQAAGGSKNVPTMHRTGAMSYAENDEVQLVSLPYKDSELTLLVALPKKAGDLDAMLGEVSGGEVAAWTKSLHEAHVALSLPKFTFSWGRSIKPELEALGVKTAFAEDADFSGIAKPKTPNDKLYLSDVFHKAFVLVDESGTEAAAATGGVINARNAVLQTIVMKVDHPFLFFVENAKTGDVLFAGRVADPKP